MKTYTKDQALDILFGTCSSYTRFPKLLGMAGLDSTIVNGSGDPCMDTWVSVLGEVWDMCDNIGHHAELLEDIISDRLNSPQPMMMEGDELRIYQSLPDEVTIYRGCYKINKWGFSWSLNRDVAARFPFLSRYYRRDEQPILVKAKVKKVNIMAVKNGRGEEEIITFNPKHISTSNLKESKDFDQAFCNALAMGVQ